MLSDILIRSSVEPESFDDGKASESRLQLGKMMKPAVVSCLLLLFGGGLVAGISFLVDSPISRILHAVGFLTLGLIPIWLFAGTLHLMNGRQKFIYMLVTATLLIGVLVGLKYLHFAAYNWLQISAATSAFLLPYTFQQLWHLLEAFSVGSGKTWSYSKEQPLQKSTTFLNSMPVKFKVQLEEGGELQYQVSFKAPVKMQLGLIFYHMVQNQQSNGGVPIHLVNAANDPYTWVFQTSWFGFKRNLDPEAGLIENGIQQNTLVIARRLGKPPKA